MMKSLIFNKYYIFLTFFLLSSSLLGTRVLEADEGQQKLFYFPEILSQFSFISYWISICFFAFVGFKVLLTKPKIPLFLCFLVAFYAVMASWSLVSFSEQTRYILLFLFMTLCPFGICFALNFCGAKNTANLFLFVAIILVFITLVFSFLNYPTHPRVSGVHNNPNLMGFWLVSIVTILFYYKKFIPWPAFFSLVTICFFLIFTSGSRVALVSLVVVALPLFKNFKFSFKSVFIYSIFIILIMFYFLGFDFDVRALQVGSAITDSGRSVIWEKAYSCILIEPILGHGMNGAESCVKIGNIHNSYLRVAVMVGIPIAFILLLFYVFFVANIISSDVNAYLKLYFLSVLLGFFAEDYVVGLASPFFPFFIFIVSLAIFDLKLKRTILEAKF